MSKLTYTPEPWQFFGNHEGDYSIVRDQDELTQILIGAVKDKNDAERLCACINALEGVPSNELPELKKLASGEWASMISAFRKMEKQRDDLLKVLTTIKNAFYTDGESFKERISDLKSIAEDALNKYYGQKKD